jgi:hypothetical protein
MNERIKQLSDIAYKNHLERNPNSSFGRRTDYDKEFAELIVRECVNTMLNTDEQKFVVETEGWELGGANHNAWDRGILDAVATVKEHFGVEE